MNKLSLILSILSIFIISNTSFAIKENKIIKVGYANYTKIIAKVDKDGSIQKEIDRLREFYQNQIENLTKEVENLEISVSSANKDNIEETVKMLEKKSLELSLLKIKSIREVEKATTNSLKKINEQVQSAIENIAKKQNFDIIIDSSLVLAASSQLDITNYVIASI